MSRILLVAICFGIVACGRQPRTASDSDPRSLAAVQKVVAEQLKRPASEVLPDATLGSLGADDLDLVEIVMATEEVLNVSIDDDALTKAAGVAQAEKTVGSLTVRKFAALADTSPKQSPQQRKSRTMGH